MLQLKPTFAVFVVLQVAVANVYFTTVAARQSEKADDRI